MARAVAQPPMRDPQLQEPTTRTRGRTVKIEGREAPHLRQRRRQRSHARDSDLVACEPSKPHCRSDPKRPTEQHPTARPHGKAHGASCRPTTDARAPTTGTPQRARVAAPLRWSVVRLGICGSAAASAVTPETSIWLSASRASLTAAPTLKRPATQHPTARPHAEAHGASCRPTTDARSPTTETPQRARVVVRPRWSVSRRGICGSAAASAVTPESPILLSASRASLTAAPTLKSPPNIVRPRARTPKHSARAVAQPPMQEPQLQESRNAHAWPHPRDGAS
jgi:hypothetical protein